MTNLNAENLLRLWETSATLSPIRRSLLLLSTAYPELSEEQWSEASIGKRDAALLSLRESLFGQDIEATSPCPECHETLELVFVTSQIRIDADQPSASGRIEQDGYVVAFRLPNSADLLAVTETPTATPTVDSLLKRCIVSLTQADKALEPEQLPAALNQTVQTEMARLDPQAEVLIALDCPQCGHHWQLHFDIVTYLWGEISDWAQRILKEVHILAKHYSWREQDILNMSAQRRRSYLELLLS